MKNKRDIMWKLTVDVNGRQEYTIKESNYDTLYEKMTDIMIRETL
jgi:hypothetical protein